MTITLSSFWQLKIICEQLCETYKKKVFKSLWYAAKMWQAIRVIWIYIPVLWICSISTKTEAARRRVLYFTLCAGYLHSWDDVPGISMAFTDHLLSAVWVYFRSLSLFRMLNYELSPFAFFDVMLVLLLRGWQHAQRHLLLLLLVSCRQSHSSMACFNRSLEKHAH